MFPEFSALFLSGLNNTTIKPVLGALTGKKVFRLLPQNIFDGLILALAVAGASWLLLG